MSWYLAPSLKRLFAELNRKYPHRDHASDGSIGDYRHRREHSDHNPNGHGSVDAIDVDKDGINTSYVIGQMKKHPSTHYIIYNRVIWNRENGFRPRRYTGSDPHTNHIHISILQSRAAENSTRPWLDAPAAPAPPPAKPATTYPTFPGTTRRGSHGSAVRAVQTRLKQRGWNITVDGDFGPKTEAVVKQFQKEKHLTQDGVVGPATWKSLWTSPVTRS